MTTDKIKCNVYFYLQILTMNYHLIYDCALFSTAVFPGVLFW